MCTWVWKRSKSMIFYHSVAWLLPVMCRSIAIHLLMTVVCLLSDLLPLNILNYSQSVDVFSKAIDVCVCVWPDAHQLHSCTVFLGVGQAGSLTSHNCWYINMFTLSSSTSPWQHPTTTRHDVVAMHGCYHHDTISQVHCISSLHLSAHRPPTSWCVGRMYWWWPSLSLF